MKHFYLFSLLFLLCSIATSQPIFTEVALNAGIDHVHKVGDFQGGGGAAVFDYDNDGLEDIYITSGKARDHLYRNNGDGTYTEVGEQAGFGYTDSVYTMGAIAGDIDNDGDRDVFVTTRGIADDYEFNIPNLLYLNNGDGTFSDISTAAGINDSAYSTTAAFGDINEDGYLDIFVGNFFPEIVREVVDTFGHFHPETSGITGSANFLYLNKRDGTFIEVADLLNVQDSGCVWAALFTDIDNDANIDLYVANDFGGIVQRNSLFHNTNPPFPLSDISVSSRTNKAMGSMGVAAGDYDEDGDLDYYITNAASNVFLHNNGDRTFDDRAIELGIDNRYIPGIPGLNYQTQACFTYSPNLNYTGQETAELMLYEYGAQSTIWVNFTIDNAYTEINETLMGDSLYVELPPNTEYESCSLLEGVTTDTLSITYTTPPNNGSYATFNKYLQQTIDWGAYFIDMDNDTDLDLYVINGALNPNMGDKLTRDTSLSLNPPVPIFHSELLDYRNHLFENTGGGEFIETAVQTGTDNVFVARGGVVFDYEEDGDMDMMVVCQEYVSGFGGGKIPRTILYRNDSPPQNWLKVKLRGTQHNPDGIGARIRAVTPDGRSFIREVEGASAVMSHSSIISHFGLANYTSLDTLEVRWMNGCRQVMTNVAVNQQLLIVEGSLNELPESVALCGGTGFTLDAPSGYSSYLWGDGSTNTQLFIQPTQDTTLSLQLTDNQGCVFMDSTHIMVDPNVISMPDTLFGCQNTPMPLSAVNGPYTYVWDTGDTTQNIIINGATSRYYYVTISNTHGCMGYDSAWVTLLPYPTISPLPENMEVCQRGDSVHIDLGNAPYDYSWNTGAMIANPSVEIAEPTTLFVTVSAPNHCPLSDTTQVAIRIMEEIEASHELICLGEETTLSISNENLQYIWSNAETNSSTTVSPTLTQNYQVSLTDSTGCSTTESILIEVHQPQGGEIAGLEPIHCIGNTDVILTPPNTTGEFIGTGITQNTFSPQLAEEGIHEIMYAFTDSLQCPDTLRSTAEVWGICPNNFFIAIGEGDLTTNFPHMEALVTMANRFDIPLTIQLTTDWVEQIPQNTSMQQSLMDWQNQGHEVGLFHYDASNNAWGGYSNEPYAQSLPNYQGDLASLLALTSNVLTADNRIWSASSTKPDTSWAIGVPYSTVLSLEPSFAFATIEQVEYFAIGSPYNSAICQASYFNATSHMDIDSIQSLYPMTTNIQSIGITIPLDAFATDSTLAEDWFQFIQDGQNETVQSIMEYNDCIQTICGRDIFEPNDSRTDAAPLPLIGTQRNSRICATDDVDWFYFDVYPDKPNLLINLREVGADYQLGLYNESGAILDSSTTADFQAEAILFPNATAERYYIKVWGQSPYQWQHKQPYSLTVQRRNLPFTNKNEGGSIEGLNEHEQSIIEAPSLSISPNPATDYIRLSLSNWQTEQALHIRMWDSQGKVVLEQTHIPNQTHLNYLLLTQQLSTGTYGIEITQQSQSIRQKIIIQHP